MVSKPSRSPDSCVPDAARLAEIDVAGQLAHDQDVQPRHHLGRSVEAPRQFRVHLRRAQIGEQAEFLAQAEDRLLRALGARQRVVLRVADGAEQDRVGLARQRERRRPAADRRPRRSRRRRPAPPRIRAAAPGGASTLSAWATISGPMPSPGSTAIFMRGLPEQPGELRLPARLERADLVGVAQRQADLVQAVQQAMLAEGSTSKPNDFAPSGVDTVCCSRSTIRRKPGSALLVEQLVDLRFARARSAAGRS